MEPLSSLIIASGIGVSAANGANDNSKGVATLVGARILSARHALWLGHLATLAGSIASMFVAAGLIRVFQGSGFLAPSVGASAKVLLIVGASATATVGLATLLRAPISTTHALTGGLLGAGVGLSAITSLQPLVERFVLPLLISPIAAAVLAGAAYRLLHRARVALGVDSQTCVCVETTTTRRWVPVSAASDGAACAITADPAVIAIHTGNLAECRQRYDGRILGVSAGAVLDAWHAASATAISFARGVNDTPKLAALLVGAAAWLTAGPAIAIVGGAMMLGGCLAARRVLRTMSDHITCMNPGSATTANTIAALLVIAASLLTLPVSTTHVTCGALFGIGVAQGRANWTCIGGIILAWIATLPIAAGIAFILARLAA